MRGADNSDFVVGKGCVAKSVFAVTLLEDASFFDRAACEKAKGRVGEDRGESFGFVVVPVFMIAQDDDAAFGTVWIVFAVAFDVEASHRWNRAWCTLAAKAEIFFSVNDVVDIVFLEAGAFFQVAVDPDLPVFVGWGESLLEGAGAFSAETVC